MEEQVNVHGFLVHVPINSWMPFFHYINLLRLGRNQSETMQELTDGYGNIGRRTFATWRLLYQQALGRALTELDAVQVGGKNVVVVMDETVVGIHADDGWTVDTKGIGTPGQSPYHGIVPGDTGTALYHPAQYREPCIQIDQWRQFFDFCGG